MRVAVVGAGMSGLATTHYLAERGVDVETFEAADEPGGVVRSRRIDGSVVEFGPQRLRLSGPVKELIDEFDLEDQTFEGHDDQPLFGYLDGNLREMPLSVRSAIRTDLLSWRGKARILLEPFTGPAKPDETVEAFLTRKFGVEAATRFMGPLYSGLYGTDPDDMYVEYSLARALEHAGIEDGSILLYVVKRLLEGVETPPIVSFEDGLQTLPAAIYERYADDVHLETPVVSTERSGADVRVETAESDDEFDAVVFTTPAPATASLLDGVDEAAAATVSRFNYNAIGVVHLRSEYDREGHGFHVLDDGFDTRGNTWNHSMLDRDGVYTTYIGSGTPALLDADDAVIGERAADEFETITGAPAEVLNVTVIRPGMPAYDRSWTALDDLSLPEDVHICSAYTSRAGLVGRIADGKRTAAAVVEGR
ncbi:MAG: protoporphyrinogen oxidase [Halanaeroarchaeum sp.]